MSRSKKICLYAEPGNESVARAPCRGELDFYTCGWRCEEHAPPQSITKLPKKADTDD